MKATKCLFAVMTAICVTSFGVAAGDAPTTPERLLNAANEPHNWLMYTQNYNGWRYSKLSQINKSNVANLKVKYTAAIGGGAMSTGRGNEQSSPLVEDGVLYLTDSHNRVMAFDVSSGERAYPLWRHDPQSEKVRATRGVALYQNSVIQVTYDGRMIALDKQSGEVIWEVNVREPAGVNPQEWIDVSHFSAVPQVFPTAGGKNIVTLGSGWPTLGVGWLAAFDADNGDLLWRYHTIPQPGEPNFGTWPGDKWKYGGAMPWGAHTFDPETNTLFVGTGEPTPVYDPEFRPGDNLYSTSTLALDADTAKLKWWFQETPNDQWDFDSSSTRMVIDVTDADGVTRKTVGNWSRNGFYYQLDRNSGQFINAIAEVDNINWTAGLDPKTGKPLEYVAGTNILQDYQTPGARRGRSKADAPLVCATWGGGPTGIWPATYDPSSGITYNTRTTGCTLQTMTVNTDEALNPFKREGIGSKVTQIQVNTMASLIAIDTASGKVVNSYVRDLEIPGTRQAEVGALATAGGLVFTAFDNGAVSAFDKDTLSELWRFNTGTSLKGPMISFSVNGKQYIAHIAGGDNPGKPGSGGISNLIMPSSMLYVYGL